MSGRLAAAFAAEWHAFDGTAAEAIEAARLALARDGRIFVEQPEFFAPGRAVLALILADELDAAERAAARALTIARERGATPELVAAWWMSGGVAWARGDLVAAEADIRQALDVARLGRLRLAELPLRAGARGRARRARGARRRRGRARGERHDRRRSRTTSGSRSRCSRAGILRLAQGRFERGRRRPRWSCERRATRWGGDRDAGAAGGDLRGARRRRARRSRARAGDGGGGARERAALGRAHARLSCALRALATTIDGADRLAALEEAVDVLEGSPARLARAEALAELGAELRRAGRRADARAPLREALDLARRCGAAGLARRAFDELTATGEKVRRYTPIGVESLTPSQRRVAELAASGMTNRQIAQTLFLTVKTIETHLAAAYDKLGIRSRQQLPVALGERVAGAATGMPGR